MLADGTFLFIIVKDKNEITNAFSNGHLLILKWDYNWKMLFNLESHKTAQNVSFARK